MFYCTVKNCIVNMRTAYRINKHQMNYTGPSGAKANLITPPLSTKDLINVQINMRLSNMGMKKLVRTENESSSPKLVPPDLHASFQMVGP